MILKDYIKSDKFTIYVLNLLMPGVTVLQNVWGLHCVQTGNFYNIMLIPNVLKMPLKPKFYEVKLGSTGVYIIFFFFAQNIDCGYSLEPPH